MADDETPFPKKSKLPDDAADISKLWDDPVLGDGITDRSYGSVPFDKPKGFFRVHPEKDYRRRTWVYTHKVEGAIEETHYVVAKEMQGLMQDDARPCTLAVTIDRAGCPRIWPIKHPRDGEKDNEAWRTARVAARAAIDKWVKLVWVKSSFQTRDAKPGYAPDPDWSKLPSFDDLALLALGEHGIIRDTGHPIYRELFGEAPKKAEKGDDDDI